MNHSTWTAWIADTDNAAADDFIQLAALRKFIFIAAKEGHADEPEKLTAAWVNKKLGPLGVTERLDGDNTYVLEAPTTGVYRRQIVAPNRAEAVRLFAALRGDQVAIRDYTVTADPTFVSGPEDPIPGVLPDDAPTTIDGTLAKLREGLLLATVAGPRLCESGVNQVLADFGLDPVPARKEFVVTRPVHAIATTIVTAYDGDSAERVAEWRWENGHTGYTADQLDSAGDAVVVEK